MRWRVHEHGIFCGTLRIARFDFDTAPSQEYREELYAEMEAKLNTEDRLAEQPRTGESFRQSFRGWCQDQRLASLPESYQALENIQTLAEENSDGSTIGELSEETSEEANAGAGPEVGGKGEEHVAGDGPYFDYH